MRTACSILGWILLVASVGFAGFLFLVIFTVGFGMSQGKISDLIPLWLACAVGASLGLSFILTAKKL